MSYTRVHCSNSSLRDSSFMLNSIIKELIFLTKQAKHNNEKIELQRRQEQKQRTTREDKKKKRRKNKNNEASQVTNQRSNGGSDEGRGNRLILNVGVLNWLNLCGFVPGFIFDLGLVGDLFSFFFCHVGLFLGLHLGLVFFFCRVGLFFASWGLIWSRFVFCHVGLFLGERKERKSSV